MIASRVQRASHSSILQTKRTLTVSVLQDRNINSHHLFLNARLRLSYENLVFPQGTIAGWQCYDFERLILITDSTHLLSPNNEYSVSRGLKCLFSSPVCLIYFVTVGIKETADRGRTVGSISADPRVRSTLLRGRSAGSFPEQRLVIEPKTDGREKLTSERHHHVRNFSWIVCTRLTT